MAAKTFIDHVKSKKGSLGTFLQLPSVTTVQAVAQSASEFIIIDMEHAPMTIDVVTQMVAAYVAACRGSKFPLVRIPSHGVEWVKWGLDSGAAGIIIPMVDDATQMKAIIDRGVYPPIGRRSYGPMSAQYADPEGQTAGVSMARYFEKARRGDVALLPMIESKLGLANVEEIMALDQVSGVLIGPADLRLALGLPIALDGPETEFSDACKKVVTTANKYGKVAGIVTRGDATVQKQAAEGFHYILSGSDVGNFVSGMNAELAGSKEAMQAAHAKL